MNKKQLAVAITCALCVTANQQAYAANDIEIVSGSTQVNITGSPSFTSTDDSAQLGVGDITTILGTDPSSTITVSTAELGLNDQSGDVTFSADLNPPSGYYNDGGFLIINAHNDINLNGAISGYSGLDGFASIDLIFNADSDGLNGGAVNLNGSMSGYFNTTINGELNISSTGSYTFSHLFQSLTVGSINVEAGGSFNFGGGTTIDNGGNLTLTNSGITIGSGGLLGDTFTLGNYSDLTLANNNVLTIDSEASFTLDLGELEVGSIVNNGSFDFVAGSLTLTDSGLTVGTGGLMGDNVTLSNRSLHLLNNNVLTIDADASLTLDSAMTVGSIVNNGSFNFTGGSLSLTNSGVTVGAGGLFGDNLSLSSTRYLTVSGDVGVEASSTLTVDGHVDNRNHFLSNLNNQGTVLLNGSLTVDGVVTNDGATSSLTIDGGSLTVGSIVNTNDGSFTFTSGHLGLTNAGLTVGTDGLLGDNVALSHTRTLAVAGDVNVDSDASFMVGGTSSNLHHFSGNLNNHGTTVIANTLTVDGAITNDGVATQNLMIGGTLTASSISNTNGSSLYMSGGVIDLGAGAVSNDGIDSNMTMAGGTLNAGSISNTNDGSFTFTGGHVNLTNSDFTVGADGLLGNNVTLTKTRALSISGDMVVENGGTLSVEGYSNDNRISGNLNNSGTVTVEADTGHFGRLVVGGTITNDGAASSLTIDGASLSAGSIVNTNDGSFSFISGSLELTNSNLTVGSGGLLGENVVLNNDRRLFLTSNDPLNNVLTVDAGANLTLDGGTLEAGSIANNGDFSFLSGNLYLNDSDLTVGSGGLLGGSVTLDVSKDLLLYGGALNIDVGGSFVLDGGLLYADNIINNGSFIFNSGDLVSSGDLNFGGSDTITLNTGSRLSLDDNGVLTLASGSNLAMDGGTLRVGSVTGGGSLDFNSGRIEFTNSDLRVGSGGLLGDALVLDSDKTLLLYGNSSNNYDTELTVDAGASVTLDGGQLYAGHIVNNGSFNFNSGQLNIGNSDLTIGDTGLLGNNVILGTDKSLSLSHYARVLTIDEDSSLVVDGGSLSVGSIANNGNFAFNSGDLKLRYSGLNIGSGGLLGDNVALSSSRTLYVYRDVNVEAGASLSVSGGVATIRGNSPSDSYANGLSNSGTVRVTGDGVLEIDDRVDNSGIVRVTNTALMQITEGTYTQSAGSTYIGAGATMHVDGLYNSSSTSTPAYIQESGSTIVNGTLSTSYVGYSGTSDRSVVINGGSLRGSGVIDGNLIMNGGQLNPGNSPGALEITGDFVLTEAGTLHMEVGSDGLDPAGYLYDQLIVGGDYDLQGGLLKFSLLDGILISDLESDFTIGDFFRSGTEGSDTAFDLPLLSMFDNLDLYAYDVLGDSWFSLALDETGGFLATASASPVPVPAAVWLFGSGLIGLFGVAKRRKAA